MNNGREECKNNSPGALPRGEEKTVRQGLCPGGEENKLKYISSGALPRGEEKIKEIHFDRGSAPGEGRSIENISSRALARGEKSEEK